MGILGLLSNRERELIERDTYNKAEFEGQYKNDWYYGDDTVDELTSEYDILENGYYIEEIVNLE